MTVIETLFIAEKPSLARAIAEGLGVERKEKSFILCRNRTAVTWCFGHLLEQAEPDEYLPASVPTLKNGKKPWRMEDLPIFPGEWRMVRKSDPGAKAQLAAIGKLLKAATKRVVNAGDPDREGQLLVDEVLEHFKCRKPVERFWASAIDPESIRRALGSLKPNPGFAGMRDAARGRSRADWLLGMNLSRFYTLREEAKGVRSLIVVGRVQTPTLTLVAQRDYAVRNFKPVPYLNILAVCVGEGRTFIAKWKPKSHQTGLDSEGRLIDLEFGQNLVNRLRNCREATVTSAETRMKRQAQPKCFSLADIQQAASKAFGFTAEKTLSVCQGLYEKHKCISYPRTDCQYLPMSQHADAPKVIAAIAKTIPGAEGICAKANPSIKSPAWNDGKVTAHHGIVPTGLPVVWSKLSEDERKIYGLVAKRYLAQFFPAYEYESTKIVLDLAGESFEATGNIPKVEGWKVLYRKQIEAEKTEKRKAAASEGGVDEEQELPKLKKGDKADVKEVKGVEVKTKPPLYYTEGTLIAAMESIHRAYEDPKIRARLKEADGIGTPATRAAIISELKRREFLVTEGKKLHCSEKGRALLLKVSPRMRSAVLTAQFEEKLKEVEAGRLSLAAFEEEVKDFVRSELAGRSDGQSNQASASSGSARRI